MEFQKIVHLLDTTSDDIDFLQFALKNGLKFMTNKGKIKMWTKKLELKDQW